MLNKIMKKQTDIQPQAPSQQSFRNEMEFRRKNLLSRQAKEAIKVQSDCNPKNILTTFSDITKKTPVKKTISTGIPLVDAFLKSRIAKAVPYVGSIIDAANTGPQIGANIARAKITYDKTCK